MADQLNSSKGTPLPKSDVKIMSSPKHRQQLGQAEACISGMVAFKFRPGHAGHAASLLLLRDCLRLLPGDAEEIKIERPADRSRKGGKGALARSVIERV